ncbi:MAG TPA: ABC transporter permease [Acidobacteriaceae bacterium]|nr:ABC transporter permease [Acidobacteriaceae bacterium]
MRIFFDRLRQVLRRLGRAPLFTTLTLVTLAVGIGATTLIFSVVDGVLLKPLPYPEPGRLIGVWYSTPKVHINGLLNLAPFLYFIDKEQSKTLEAIGAYSGDSLSVTGTGQPEHVSGLDVTQEVLPILGVKPALGRLFTQKDDSPGSPETVLLSYAFWQKKFGGKRGVIGQALTVDGKPREIIGVLPKGFHFLDWNDAALILPMQLDRSKTHLGSFNNQGLARLKPGVTIAEASADLQRLIPIAIRSFPPPPGYSVKLFEAADFRTALHPLKQDVVGDVGNVLWVLMGSIVMVLLIACANVANLLLVRVEGRRQELAVRSALGAGWRKIAGDLLFESVLLSLAGSALGLALAYGGLKLLVGMAPDLPRVQDIGINVPVLLFTLGLAIATGVLIGLIPVFKFVGGQLNAGLREGGRALSQSRERHRARSTLVVAQVALALVLLICSGLMIRTFRALEEVNPGFTNPNALQTFRIDIPDTQIPDKDRDKLIQMEQAMMDKIAALPGVKSVALTSSIPMAGWNSNDLIYAADRTYGEGEIPPIRRFIYASPGLFRTLGTPMIAGRGFTWEDNYNKLPVAIISENFAKEYWGSAQKALGKRIRAASKDDWRQIVGVVGDVHQDGISENAPTTVYLPLLVNNFDSNDKRVQRGVAFVIRTPQAGSQAFMQEVKQAIWSVDSDLPLAMPHTEDYFYTQSMARTQFTLVMLGVAGAMALLLGMVGIYGVISYSVSQRTREIGIRMALGSPRSEIVGLFVRDGLKLATIGIGCGLITAFAAMRLMASLLYGVSAYDPLTYAAITVGIFATVWVACWLPSQRAATVDPMNALRAE